MTTIKSEKDVKREVKRLLDKYLYFWWCPPANGYGRSGISDFHALKDGVFLAIETKFGRNPATPLQRAFLESVAATNGLALVVSEQNLDWFEVYLERFDEAQALVRFGKQLDEDAGAHFMNAYNALVEGWR